MLSFKTKRGIYIRTGESGCKKMSEEQNKSDHCAEVQGSPYLIACDDQERERRKEWLYEILGPVFFGEKEAADTEELRQLFQEKYGIDVQHDFVEGDEHYDEYLEAQQAIAEGMSIYGGEISFGDSTLAELAERVWACMEEKDRSGFRRINTMLEE